MHTPPHFIWMVAIRRIFAVAVVQLVWCTLPVWAESDVEELYQQEPFDVLVLSQAYGQQKFSIFPVDVPQSPDAKSMLRVRLLGFPSQYYDVAWKNIDQIITFEESVLAKANELIADKQFDRAYWYIEYLLRQGGSSPQLEQAISSLLFQDAADANRRGAFAESLSLLDEIRRRNASNSTIVMAAEKVAEKMFRKYLQEGDVEAAASMIEWAESRFGRKEFDKALTRWEDQLQKLASEDLAAAKRAIKQGDDRKAFELLSRARRTWPELKEIASVSRQLANRFSVVNVGVTRPATDFDPRKSEDWAARRAGRLRHRTLVELQSYGPDGGEFYCPIGSLNVSPDSQEVRIELKKGVGDSLSSSLSGADLADMLLQMSRPNRRNAVPVWRQLVDRIAVTDVDSIRVQLKQPVLKPEALFQIPLNNLDDETPPGPTNPYLAAIRSDGELRFSPNPLFAAKRVDRPVEIIEHYFENPATLVNRFLGGEVDVIDRLFPADVQVVKRANQSDIVVQPYAVPSIHFLLPNLKRPLMQQRSFRQAIVYGISRPTILQQDLLGNAVVAGTQVISGPLPPGVANDDPLGYAYDRQIEPRVFEPTLALTLAGVAKAKLGWNDEASDDEHPERNQPLILVHPAAALPRIASSAIAQYLSAIGLNCQTREMPLGQTMPDGDQWDLLYMDMVFTEPMFDIRRLLGADGLLEGGSPYLELALRQLRLSVDWERTRETLKEIHRLAHEEVAVVPLWQVVEFLAYRQCVKHIPTHPLTLYQDVEAWQVKRGTP